jgi:prevent-host-death family protein
VERKRNEETLSATAFRGNVSSVLRRVATSGQPVVVTKRGKPIVRVVPVRMPRSLKGSIIYQGDIVSPLLLKWETDAR